MTRQPGEGPLRQDPAGLSGKPLQALIVSVVLAAAGYLAFAVVGGWAEVTAGLARIGWLGFGVALLLSLVNYGLRFARWQMYLGRMGHPVAWWPSLKIYLAGFALTTTPGKAGEAMRGVLLKPRGVPYPTSFAAFLSERLSDLLAVVVLALFGLASYPQARPLVAIAAVALAGLALVMASRRLLRRCSGALEGPGRIRALGRHLVDVLLQARRCHSPAAFLAATVLSIVAWAAEAWALHLVLQAMGAGQPLAFAVFVYAISMLAGALSFLPGGLGGAEAVMVLLLTGAGMALPDALGATIVIRLATLWFAVGLGLVFMPLTGRH